MPAIDDPLFTVAQAAQAASMSVSTLRSWMQTGNIVLGSVDADAPQGGTRRLSYRRVLQIAIAAELVDIGFAPRHAGMNAAGFTDLSSDAEKNTDGSFRYPGDVFKSGITLMLAYNVLEAGRTVRINEKTSALELFYKVRHRRGRSYVALNINTIDANVRSSLGLDMNWGRGWLETPTSLEE